MRSVLAIAALAVLGVARPVFAAGFQFDGQSARGMGMQNAMTAHVDDASSLFYNPAGMMRVDKLQVQLGVAGVMSRTAFTSQVTGVTTLSKGNGAAPPHAYVLYN